jgi:hypothetical protein
MVLPTIISLARGALAFNAIGATPILKIHPSIGIARLGDAPTGFFIGPERPFAGNTGQDAGAGSAVPPASGGSFRAGGQIKRQAARFRIFNYLAGGVSVEELNLDHPEVAEIEWTVHLANRKAAFFQFRGQQGATGPYAAGSTPPRRNKSITGAARESKLVIDPGPRSIKGASAGPVKFDSSSGNFPKNSAGAPVIDFLGELQTDNKGRLLVLGGRGKSASSDALPPNSTEPDATINQVRELRRRGFSGPLVGTGRPPAPLLDYANNDTWFDDISDGPVTAKVKLKSGKTLTVSFPAWVLVGPPDFAPEIRSVISLYDTMYDVAVRKLPTPAPPFYSPFDLLDLKMLKDSLAGTPGFQPEFFFDIDPILQAGALIPFVHKLPAPTVHNTLTPPQLRSTAPADQGAREIVFLFLRPPAGNTTYSGAGSMPKLFGDKYFTPGDPKRVAAVTETQHHILKLWKDGNFIVGSGGASPSVTPEGLDRAALESCVGGAFFPGIECSWLVREKDLYSEPFRIKHGAKVGTLTVGPGFFSQQMALPWQADFNDCAKDDSTVGVFYGWWPAQRPDDVFTNTTDAAARTTMFPWDRGVPASPTDPRGQTHANMVARWNKLGFVVSATTSAGAKVFIETERTLP